MAGFVANPPAAADTIVAGDGWWPCLSMTAFKAGTRMPPNLADARIQDALVAGMIEAARELASWRAEKEAAGAASLDAIPAPTFAGESELVTLYRRAVFALAGADLADTSNDITATEAGRQRTEVRATSAAEHRRNATAAIRRIRGRTRNRATLI
jgi:hypothetical protein